MSGIIDFGYPWWISYGHLPLFGASVLLLALAYVRKWPRLLLLLLGAVVLWSGSAFVIARLVLNINGRASMPTGNFLPSGRGRVLDMGAGTGRSALMVLEARPRATLVALDEFGRSYKEHFGPERDPRQTLLSNLRAAGVEHRATIHPGDMRTLPFEAGAFDAIVSAYAIDHLNRQGVSQALSEAARVLKPDGEFLLMVIGKDPYLQFTFGPLLLHGGLRGTDYWSERLTEAGFHVAESGSRPATLYLLAKKH